MSRKNISLNEVMEERAQALIRARGFSGLSDLLATLIREEYERRHPLGLKDSLEPPPALAVPPNVPVTYRKRKGKTNV